MRERTSNSSSKDTKRRKAYLPTYLRWNTNLLSQPSRVFEIKVAGAFKSFKFLHLILNFLNGPSQASFWFIFVFSNKHYNFYNKYMLKNVHPVYRALDLNPRPSEHESPPTTTRPGLPPVHFLFYL